MKIKVKGKHTGNYTFTIDDTIFSLYKFNNEYISIDMKLSISNTPIHSFIPTLKKERLYYIFLDAIEIRERDYEVDIDDDLYREFKKIIIKHKLKGLA